MPQGNTELLALATLGLGLAVQASRAPSFTLVPLACAPASCHPKSADQQS